MYFPKPYLCVQGDDTVLIGCFFLISGNHFSYLRLRMNYVDIHVLNTNTHIEVCPLAKGTVD